jgi:hypothetical protein
MLDLMTQLRELNVTGAQNWDMSSLHGRLSNIYKLRVIKSACCLEEAGRNNLVFEMEQDIQGMASLSKAARSTSLTTVTIDDCVGLENICFRGCQELKDLFFTGLFVSLEELDLSNTAIKFLNLKNVEATHLKRLILLGCKKLRAILWPPKYKRTKYLEVLRIDNTQSALSGQSEWGENIKEDTPSIGSSSSAGGKELVGCGQAASFEFNWQISMSDARLLRSIVPIEQYLKGKCVCIEMDSYPASTVVSGGIPLHGVIMLWACPPAPTLTANDCYFHIQDEEMLQRSSDSTASPPALICSNTNVLHVHNSLSITGFFPPDSGWNSLEWCKVERCPKLSSVFPNCQKGGDIFRRLRTFWASQLPKAHYIWTWSYRTTIQPSEKSFHCLEFLHVDCCPKLLYVFPIWMDTLPCLETLEIVCCGDLKTVFTYDHFYRNSSAITKFPRLRRLHLHELPMMQETCGHMIFAPVLETVKIKGCRSLRRLPAVTGNTKLPKVDCEKEWWENLEWDGINANHHPSLYQLSDPPN